MQRWELSGGTISVCCVSQKRVAKHKLPLPAKARPRTLGQDLRTLQCRKCRVCVQTRIEVGDAIAPARIAKHAGQQSNATRAAGQRVQTHLKRSLNCERQRVAFTALRRAYEFF